MVSVEFIPLVQLAAVFQTASRRLLLVANCGSPKTTMGQKFAEKALDGWANSQGLQLRFIQLGKSQQNAYIEGFNGKFRDECLNEHWFISMHHARKVFGEWRQEYNGERSHSSLDYLTRKRFAENFLTADSDPLINGLYPHLHFFTRRRVRRMH